MRRGVTSGTLRAHPGQLEPLRVPAFGRLLVSYTTNSIGDYVGLVALALLVYGETQDPLATTALFIAAQFLPAFIAPILTAHLDQLRLRRVLPAIYLGEALVFAAARAARPVLLARAGAAARPPRRRPDAHRPRPLARSGERGPTAKSPAAERETRCSTSASPPPASAGPRSAGCSSRRSASSRRRFGVDAASFAVIALLLATCRGLPSAERGTRAVPQARRRGAALRAHQPGPPGS